MCVEARGDSGECQPGRHRHGQPGGARAESEPELSVPVSSRQSQTDHSATQRERRVAQQDATASQAKVKPKLSVGVTYPTVQL